MRHFKRLCALLFLLAGCAFAQTYPTGPEFFPADAVGNQVCIYIQTFENGRLIATNPAPGVAVTFNNPTATPTSGGHIHENTIGNPPRTPGYYVTSTAQVTDSTGCASAIYQMPNLAGTYTFTSQHISPIDQQIHVNGVTNKFAYFHPIWGSMVSYPDNPTTNVPQVVHQDAGHIQQTRYFIVPVQQGIEAASADYLSVSTQVAGVSDRLDIYRGSIPDGGISDNEVYGADLWTVSAFEEHQWGAEADISNPNLVLNGLYAFMLQALNRQSCTVGQYQKGTGGHLSDPISYWQNQNPVHIACASAGFDLPGSGKSPTPIGGGRPGKGQ